MIAKVNYRKNRRQRDPGKDAKVRLKTTKSSFTEMVDPGRCDDKQFRQVRKRQGVWQLYNSTQEHKGDVAAEV
jgi:hypothetical protein